MQPKKPCKVEVGDPVKLMGHPARVTAIEVAMDQDHVKGPGWLCTVEVEGPPVIMPVSGREVCKVEVWDWVLTKRNPVVEAASK